MSPRVPADTRPGATVQTPESRGPRGDRRFQRLRTVLGHAASSRILLFLAVIGPGIITANVDNDPGGITTYSLAGGNFGYGLLWTMFPIFIALAVIQEMCVRMGVVTGKGLADLIRENFGLKTTFYLLTALLFTNIFNTMSEFAGVAAASELFGVSRYIAVPVVAVVVTLLVLKASYSLVERVFLGACVFYVAYVVAAILAKPDWGEVTHALVVPHVQFSSAFLVMAIGVVGTTIAPWMQFYIQSSTVDKGVKVKELPYSRVDVTAGSVMTQVVAGFIIITCAATLFKFGIHVDTAAEAAQALRPLAGRYATVLFGAGLLVAGIFSATILPLATAYYVCEGLGWPAGLNHSFKEARQFYYLFGLILGLGALLILIPHMPLIQVMYLSQVCNGVLLPFVLVMMLRLVNDEKLMGEHTNGIVLNAVTYLTIALIIVLTLGSAFVPLFSRG